MLKAIAIDDEKAAISHLTSLAAANAQIEIIAGLTDPMEGFVLVQKLCPQVVFLDISMPEMSGLYLAEQIMRACPQTGIVFVTSHDDYALKAFELDALDYLLKPLTQERFDKCVAKLLQHGFKHVSRESLHSINQGFREAVKKLFIEDGDDLVLLNTKEICYFEVKGKTIAIKTAQKEYISANSLAYFEAKLQNSNFFRCHRSYLINLDKVARLIPYSKSVFEVGFSDIKESALVSKQNVATLKRLLEY